MTSTPLTDQQLLKADLDHGVYRTSHSHPGAFACCTAHAAADHVPALLAEVRRQRALLATLADRWVGLADQGDVAIGHFEGPAAAVLDAEVGERGRTYRKAASDVRMAITAGRLPHDLLTAVETGE